MPNISLIRKSLCAQNWIKDLSLYILFLPLVQYGRAGIEEEENKEKKQSVTEGERKR